MVQQTGWVKLEIPLVESHTDKTLQHKIVALNQKLFVESLRTYLFDVQPSQPHLVGEQDCEEYYEIDVQIACESFRLFVAAVRNFYSRLFRESLRPYEKANIVIVSPKFFSNQLVCAMSDVPLTAIYFGNVQGNVFMNHWEVSFLNEQNDRIRRMKRSKQQMHRVVPQADKLYQLKAEFEFDKNDLLTIHFRNREMKKIMDERVNEYRNQEVTMFYTILVKRQHIRRVVCDPYLPEDPSDALPQVRLHFDLNCPVLVRNGFVTDATMKDNKKGRGDPDSIFPQNMQRTLLIRRGRQPGLHNVEWPNPLAIADSPFFTIQFPTTAENLYTMLSRFKARTSISIEFASMPVVDVLFGRHNPYHRWAIKENRQLVPTDYEAPVYSDFINKLWPRVLDSKGNDANRERRFAFTYLIEALISRGAVVKDQILLDVQCWIRFLQIITHYYLNVDAKMCEAALEDLIHMIDGRKRIGAIYKCLVKICDTRHKNRLAGGLTEDELREGYQRVRKIVFTPTRIIYIAPETLMGNRVLRKYDSDGTKILRIAFRDDDNMKMRSSKTSDHLITKTVSKYLTYGVIIAGHDFGYLGSSNSQMRDNGAYFMQKYSRSQKKDFLANNPAAAIEYKKSGRMSHTFIPKIREARKALGRFETVDNIPKMMARLGQCFTQSRLSGVNLQRENCLIIADVIGGQNGKGFVN
ncbi:hypothetical protein WR25_15506 isoform D [Diploscapter pachys]|uniref:RNA-dependent RNA polymerase n=1 Tax=Diploscapter pachys TaxID=2018661 RepID=A0A2A2J3P5_9BILA|nr:hypothetical protein WR25_15506 isoform D [Diploscapter pachys]